MAESVVPQRFQPFRPIRMSAISAYTYRLCMDSCIFAGGLPAAEANPRKQKITEAAPALAIPPHLPWLRPGGRGGSGRPRGAESWIGVPALRLTTYINLHAPTQLATPPLF